jgi:hypothetical protein
MSEEIIWQDEVAKAMGAIRCSPTERRRAFAYLAKTGIAEKIGGGLAETTRSLVASGEIEGEDA